MVKQKHTHTPLQAFLAGTVFCAMVASTAVLNMPALHAALQDPSVLNMSQNSVLFQLRCPDGLYPSMTRQELADSGLVFMSMSCSETPPNQVDTTAIQPITSPAMPGNPVPADGTTLGISTGVNMPPVSTAPAAPQTIPPTTMPPVTMPPANPTKVDPLVPQTQPGVTAPVSPTTPVTTPQVPTAPIIPIVPAVNPPMPVATPLITMPPVITQPPIAMPMQGSSSSAVSSTGWNCSIWNLWGCFNTGGASSSSSMGTSVSSPASWTTPYGTTNGDGNVWMNSTVHMGPGNASEVACFDNLDNDGDAAFDLSDSDCAGQAVPESPTSLTCLDGIDNDGQNGMDRVDPGCALENLGGPNDCTNGADDDANGPIDCEDSSCSGTPACNGGTSTSSFGTWTPPPSNSNMYQSYSMPGASY